MSPPGSGKEAGPGGAGSPGGGAAGQWAGGRRGADSGRQRWRSHLGATSQPPTLRVTGRGASSFTESDSESGTSLSPLSVGLVTPLFLLRAVTFRHLHLPFGGGLPQCLKGNLVPCLTVLPPPVVCREPAGDLWPISLGFKATEGGHERGNDPRHDVFPSPCASLERIPFFHLAPWAWGLKK